MSAKTIVDSLLRSPEPSIRWKTRTAVLGESPRSAKGKALQEEIRASRRARALLARRSQLGRPGTARAVYYKWQGWHWVLASLADLGYPRGDEALHPIRDRVLDFWLAPTYFHEFEARTEDAAYRRRGVPIMQGRHRRCASQQGNALRAVVALGVDDGRAKALVERLLHWEWPDGGWNCDREPSADTSSFMETRLPMLGLAAYARERRDAKAARAVDRAAEVFLRRRLAWRASDGRVIRPEFVALHYPLYYHYDFLGGLVAMAQIGKIRDPRCADALDLLEEKRLPDGGWPAEKRYQRGTSKTLRAHADYVDWGGGGARQRNDWVTVDALGVLVALRHGAWWNNRPMRQAVWTGAISFGLVSIPVKLYPATEPKDVRFHFYDRLSGKRVRYERVTREDEAPAFAPEPPPFAAPSAAESDAADRAEIQEDPDRDAFEVRSSERAVSAEDMVRGIELPTGDLVTVSEDDLVTLAPERSREIAIEEFVDLAQIDPVFYEKSYHVAPGRSAGAEKPYALLHEAMRAARMVGIGRFVLRTKPHLVAIRPLERTLALETLFFGDEVRSPEETIGPLAQVNVSERELAMARQLVRALATEWVPEKHADTYRQELLALLQRKSPATPPEASEEAAFSPASDLMARLVASVEAAKQRSATEAARRRGRGSRAKRAG
ncbi:MAG: hypothetical protein AUH85_10355 [Chloroflexi bacterium 13_1_40CM_4_68_4]|nr:MAG: hypothetical protein AUH85_10355 [Chloroflexi bacterium 13_1_40CM_4_68_4]